MANRASGHHVGLGQPHVDLIPERIDQNMAFAVFDFLVAVKADVLPLRSGLVLWLSAQPADGSGRRPCPWRSHWCSMSIRCAQTPPATSVGSTHRSCAHCPSPAAKSDSSTKDCAPWRRRWCGCRTTKSISMRPRCTGSRASYCCLVVA